MTWVRKYDGPSAEGNTTDATATEVYLLSGNVPPAAIQFDPTLFLGGNSGTEQLPDYGSPHPNNPSLKLIRYNATRDGATTEITATYGKSSRFGSTNPDHQERNVIIGRGSTRDVVTTDIPYGRLIHTVTAVPTPILQAGPPEQFVADYWKVEKYKVREPRRTITYKVLIGEPDIDQAEDEMDKQDQRLHRIYGTFYMYYGSDVTPENVKAQDGTNLYSLTHHWVRDTGTIYPALPPTYSNGPLVTTIYFQAFLSGLVPGMERQVGWLRPPFHVINFDPSVDGQAPPRFYMVLPITYEPDGWRDLPGMRNA